MELAVVPSSYSLLLCSFCTSDGSIQKGKSTSRSAWKGPLLKIKMSPTRRRLKNSLLEVNLLLKRSKLYIIWESIEPWNSATMRKAPSDNFYNVWIITGDSIAKKGSTHSLLQYTLIILQANFYLRKTWHQELYKACPYQIFQCLVDVGDWK